MDLVLVLALGAAIGLINAVRIIIEHIERGPANG